MVYDDKDNIGEANVMLNHSCKNFCSGWEAGRARGRQEVIELLEQINGYDWCDNSCIHHAIEFIKERLTKDGE